MLLNKETKPNKNLCYRTKAHKNQMAITCDKSEDIVLPTDSSRNCDFIVFVTGDVPYVLTSRLVSKR